MIPDDKWAPHLKLAHGADPVHVEVCKPSIYVTSDSRLQIMNKYSEFSEIRRDFLSTLL
jgi:hypothetical protein